VQRACSSSPLLVRTSFLVRLGAIVFACATVWFVCYAETSRPDRIVIVNRDPPATVATGPTVGQAVNVVDVAALAVSPAMVSQLVRIGDEERITTVDDRAVESNLEAATLLSERVSRITSREYIDLSVRGPAGHRRVLVLFH
jgi:hypothetical protein